MPKASTRREWRTHEQAQSEVKRYRESGMTAEAYAASHQMNVRTLRGLVYRTERKVREQSLGVTKSLPFVPLKVTQKVARASQVINSVDHDGPRAARSAANFADAFDVEIQLLNGRIVRAKLGSEVAALARLVTTLDARC